MKGRYRQTASGSFKRDFYKKATREELINRCDFHLILDDDEMEELEKIDHRQAVMLQRGTGKLRMCSVCGDVYVNTRVNELKWGVWFNRHGFKCFFCRNSIKKPNNKKNIARNRIMKKVWDLWIKRLHVGVKVTYL